MAIYIKRFSFLFFVVIFSCQSGNKNDFELFCDFVTKVENAEAFTSKNLKGNYEKFYKHLDKSSAYGKELKDSFNGVTHVSPSEKYNVFKELAELTSKNWSCKPLERFYASTKAVLAKQ